MVAQLPCKEEDGFDSHCVHNRIMLNPSEKFRKQSPGGVAEFGKALVCKTRTRWVQIP